jgi:hypothetical protein
LSRDFAPVVGHEPIDAGKASLPSEDSQLLAGVVLGALQTDFPATFVSFGRVSPGVDEYYVNFTTEPTEEITKRLSDLPFDVTLNWGFPATAAQLEAAADELTRALDADPRVSALRVGGVSDQAKQGIEVRLDVASDARADEAALVTDAMAKVDAARSDENQPGVPVVLSEAQAGYEAQMDVKGGYGTNCSRNTGFTASWNGNLGAMTAAHGNCSSLTVYNSASGVIDSFGMPKRPTVAGGYVDVWFVKTVPGNATTYRFRDSMSTDIVATGVGNVYQNMDVCKFGTSTGRSCGQVTPLYVLNSASFCATNSIGQGADGLTYCRLWEANRDVTESGDSGGPWFLGQAAIGITAGEATNSVFTAATAIETQGIIVRQQ